MRHCMVVHARYPIGETRVEREAGALINQGHEVDVICLLGRGETAQEIVDGVNVYRMPVKRRKNSGALAQLFEYLAFFFLASFKLLILQLQRHYHVIQAHNLPDWLVFVGLVPRLTGARIILDLHDLMPEFYAARFNRGLDSWPARLLILQERISCRFADHVITVTEAWRQTLIGRGVPASKVSVVMNVADDRYFFYCEPGVQPAAPNGHLQLLYHGNVTQRYGIDLAIRAVGLVGELIPGVNLYIHGWGDARQAMIDLVAELGLEEHVQFSIQGLLTSELPDLIRKADVCVVPYRQDVFTDGILPTKLMEYAALGKPAIVARTSTIAQYFDESMVEFFKPGDVSDLAHCIRKLYVQPECRKRLAEGILSFNSRYQWSTQSSQYIQLVERLAAL
jgi:glycosyltransferase involved in cell wall biosynthesis